MTTTEIGFVSQKRALDQGFTSSTAVLYDSAGAYFSEW
jgi:hypothetical protein